MHCREEELILWAHGRLSGLAAWRMRRHLSRCEHCRTELSRLETLGAELRELTARLPSKELDSRIQSIRPDSERTGWSLPFLRIPLPLIGAVAGLLVGGVQTQNYRPISVDAKTTITMTGIPNDGAIAVIPTLLRTYAPIDDPRRAMVEIREQKFWSTSAPYHAGAKLVLVCSASTTHKARYGLEAWVAALERGQHEVALLSPARIGTIHHEHQPITVVDREGFRGSNLWTPLLLYAAIGALVGGAFWVCRLIGPWIPGGLPANLILGCFLGVGLGYLNGARIQTQYDAQSQVTLTPLATKPLTESREYALLWRLLWERNEALPRLEGASAQNRVDTSKVQGVMELHTVSPDRTVAEVSVQRWVSEVRAFKGWEALGYKLAVSDKITVSTNPIRNPTAFWASLAGGLAMGVVMAFSRKR